MFLAASHVGSQAGATDCFVWPLSSKFGVHLAGDAPPTTSFLGAVARGHKFVRDSSAHHQALDSPHPTTKGIVT